MRFIKKGKLIKIICYIFLVISILSLIEWPRSVDQSKIIKCINNYYSEKGKDNKVFNVVYELLGNEKHGMIVNQYIYIHEDEYIKKDNNLVPGSSMGAPIRVKLISFFGFYKVLLVSDPPEDGDSYAIYLKLFFPEEVLKKLDDNRQKYGHELDEKSEEQLKEIKRKLNLN